jgi:2'-5' RNA ligase
MYTEALALCGLERDRRSFLPHLSLLYSHLKSDKKQALIDGCPSLDFEGDIDRIALMKTEGPPDQWQQIVEVKLT